MRKSFFGSFQHPSSLPSSEFQSTLLLDVENLFGPELSRTLIDAVKNADGVLFFKSIADFFEQNKQLEESGYLLTRSINDAFESIGCSEILKSSSYMEKVKLYVTCILIRRSSRIDILYFLRGMSHLSLSQDRITKHELFDIMHDRAPVQYKKYFL